MADNNSKLKQLRERAMPEFKSQDERYSYMAKSHLTLNKDELYEACSDSLLPVFKVAKELCEYIHTDKDYFRKDDMMHNYPLTRLYHMAIVSKAVQKINELCESPEDKILTLGMVASNYSNPIRYIKDGKSVKTDPILEQEEIKNFRKAANHLFDDKYFYRYMGDMELDVDPSYYGKAYSFTGNVSNWEDLKKSDVMLGAAVYCYGGMVNKETEQNLRTKINEFCDMKQAQLVKQMQQQTRHEVKG